MAENKKPGFWARLFGGGKPKGIPTLLLAHSPKQEPHCVEIGDSLLIGREADPGLSLNDLNVSRRHALIFKKGKRYFIEDQGSKTGTFVNGTRAKQRVELAHNSVVRVGNTVLVFAEDGSDFAGKKASSHTLMAGPFHNARLVKSLEELAAAKKNVLLNGPAGVGKETASKVFANIVSVPLVVLNASCFSSVKEAMITLFEADKESGRLSAVEKAKKGILFIDEAENLPSAAQERLAKVMENGGLFVLASNDLSGTRGLRKDLLARLTLVEVPSLKERSADVPSLFNRALKEAAKSSGVELALTGDTVRASQYEALMLDGFETENARGLVKVAGAVALKMESGTSAEVAVDQVFDERYATSYGSSRNAGLGKVRKVTQEVRISKDVLSKSLDAVIDSYERCGGDVAAIERDLRDREISLSIKLIGQLLDELDLPVNKK